MAVSMMPSMAFAESLPDGADSDGIIYPTVNFTDVAPFLDPVEGVSPRTYARSMVRTMSIAPQAGNSTTDNGMNISKTATANDDGSYTIQLEAYATGSKVISEVTKDVPTDIVLVLDQSGSMDNNMNTYSFKEYTNKTNSDYYNLRHNGGRSNLYYKLKDESYATVSVSIEEGDPEPKYTAINNGRNNYDLDGSTSYYANKDNLYAKVNGEYEKVTVSRKSSNISYTYTYTYTLENGTVIATSEGRYSSPTFIGIDGDKLYLQSVETQKNYTYTYADKDSVTQTIGTSTGANTQPSDFVLYERYSTGTMTRLQALKNAVASFSDNVALKAKGQDGVLGTDDDIQHRIAVVGFASKSGYGNNTELLSIAGSNSGNVGVAYNNITESNLKDVLQPMSSQDGQTMVSNAINALAAQGATETNLGVDMAKRILDANPVPDGQQRNRVVIVFTDGSPTSYNGFELGVANSAISKANEIKAGGTTVYSVGIFSGADATSAGSKPAGDLDNNSNQLTSASNWFMQNLSSNNGTVQTPSYYLSAADSNALNNIFQQISDQIESGGSSTTLSSETVIKDIISPQFTLPENASEKNITLETYHCTGSGSNGEYTWERNSGTMGATATVNGDAVSVQGFDFAENYVGTVTENGNITYRGDKLVISFKVEPKDGFLGGNNVYTNTSAGVYENSTAETPVLTFERPQVNVPIEDVTVAATDKNVYLLGSLTAEQLTSVKVGDVTLDLNPTAVNFGLADWQTEYVTIEATITDENGNTITDFTNLTDDQSYTVSVTVKPKTTGDNSSGTAASEKTADASANVNVFKPVVTFKDSEVYYGADAPVSYAGNRVSTAWKHGNTDADASMGTAPVLTFSYEAGTGIDDGKINIKDDIPVDVTTTIKIGDSDVDVTDHTTYLYQNCDGKTCNRPADKEFLLHVKTCQLTITKEGGVAGEPYVFSIMKDNADSPYTTITITGNESKTISELPVGTYTVTEDTDWSWRYDTPVIEVDGETTPMGVLSSTNPTVSFTVTNSINNDKWLNDFSTVIQNVYNPLQTNQQ